MNSQLTELLRSKKFEEARLILQSNLEKGELFDPRGDRLWAPIADTISANIIQENGLDAVILFWEELLEFFRNRIEPVWGHAHKGHIYFRLALHVGKHDFAKARSYLSLARAEDMIQQRNLGGTEEDILARAQQSSSHVALVLLERIKETDFDSSEEQAQFFDNLFGPSFDAAINGQAVNPNLVLKALEHVVPEQTRSICISLYRELSTVSNQNLPFAIVSLTGTVLESILLGILIYQKDVSTLPNGRSIKDVELGTLVNQAIVQNIFPTKTVKSTMRLVHILRNRLHPGNEMQQEHKLTDRVSITLKIMFELAVVEWSHSIA